MDQRCGNRAYIEMKVKRTRILVGSLVIGAAVALMPVAHAVPIVVDFEGLSGVITNGTLLGPAGTEATFNTINGGMSVIQDVSGNDLLLVGGDSTAGSGILEVIFPYLVESVSAVISDSTYTVVIEAYDSGGTLLATSGGGGVPGPDTLSIYYGSQDIYRILIHDQGFDYYVDDVTWYGIIAVAEPGTIGLLGAGLLGLAFARRRRAKL